MLLHQHKEEFEQIVQATADDLGLVILSEKTTMYHCLKTTK